jgi:hypothetical protein
MGGSGLLPCKLTPERHCAGSPIAADFRMFGQSARQVFQRSVPCLCLGEARKRTLFSTIVMCQTWPYSDQHRGDLASPGKTAPLHRTMLSAEASRFVLRIYHVLGASVRWPEPADSAFTAILLASSRSNNFAADLRRRRVMLSP